MRAAAFLAVCRPHSVRVQGAGMFLQALSHPVFCGRLFSDLLPGLVLPLFRVKLGFSVVFRVL